MVRFSMADNPNMTIWAGGKAGWFEIQPDPSYQDVYDRMSEGVLLYFFLCDTYTENKARKAKGSKAMDLDLILTKV